MDISHAIILGLVQGVTEFLPVSSLGHLVLVRELLQIESVDALAFDAILHFATALAVSIYFWRDLRIMVLTLFRKLARLPVNERDLTLIYALLIGTLPAAALGIIIEPFVSGPMQSALFVAAILFVAALFFMYAEWRYFTKPNRTVLNVRLGLFIGCFQALALLPGFSRSGATLAGGMLLGLSRFEAARFSFLLAIPITFGVGIKKSFDLAIAPGEMAWTALLVGATVAFISALIVIHFFLAFIRRYTLWPFVWYTMALALLVAYVELFVWS
jgi:undecaprenyl-diphosphatase